MQRLKNFVEDTDTMLRVTVIVMALMLILSILYTVVNLV